MTIDTGSVLAEKIDVFVSVEVGEVLSGAGCEGQGKGTRMQDCAGVAAGKMSA